MQNFWLKAKKIILNKYILASLLFLSIFLFSENYNLIDRWKNHRTINRLNKEIKYYENEIKENKTKLLEMQSGTDVLEKYGRENFYFKKDSEDIFIVKDESDEK